MTRAEELLAILLRDGDLIEGGSPDGHGCISCQYCYESPGQRRANMTVNDHAESCPVREAVRLVVKDGGKDMLGV